MSWLDYGSFAQVESWSLAGETVEKAPQPVGEGGGGWAIERDSWKEDVFGEGRGAQKEKGVLKSHHSNILEV